MFNLKESIEDAERRFGKRSRRASRRRRNDHGKMRLEPALVHDLRVVLGGHERKTMPQVLAWLTARCQERGERPPSRTTVYNFMSRDPGPSYSVSALPEPARSALYNVAPDAVLPGRQVAFYCFNYGSMRAMMFAAGLPWLALYQAARMRGFRERTRGLLTAVLRARGI